jgi:hypothetical protein
LNSHQWDITSWLPLPSPFRHHRHCYRIGHRYRFPSRYRSILHYVTSSTIVNTNNISTISTTSHRIRLSSMINIVFITTQYYTLPLAHFNNVTITIITEYWVRQVNTEWLNFITITSLLPRHYFHCLINIYH